MIKAVLFDFFGVLTEGGREGAIRQVFAKAYNVDPETLRFEDVGLGALKGQMDDAAFIAAMNAKHPGGEPVSPSHFEETVDGLAASAPVYALAKTLREHGLKTAILSNVLLVAAERLRAHGLYEGFDPLLLSCEVHLAKPEQAIYDQAVAKLGCKPEEILYIDDQEEFLVPARAMGIHTILAVSPQQIVAEAKTILKQENSLELTV